MSNPGVIVLAEKDLSSAQNYRIEDNLGEAIHIHYANIRIDLRVEEFLTIAKSMEEVLNNHLGNRGFRVGDYDSDFLNRISHCLVDLEKVEYQTIRANSLRLRDRLGPIPLTKRISRKAADAVGRMREEDGKVVLFNKSPVVMYGERRALEVFKNNPGSELAVTRLVFRDGRHSVPPHPWMSYFFRWDKRRVVSVLKKIARRIF